mgnify:CR=1 FL=1
MLRDNEVTSGEKIRKYLYQVIGYFALCCLIGVGYFSWSQIKSNSIKETIYTYHLTSSFHYLKALKQIQHLQNYYNYQTLSQENKKPQVKSILINSTISEAGLRYAIEELIQSAVLLQRHSNNDLFHSLEELVLKRLNMLIKANKQNTLSVPYLKEQKANLLKLQRAIRQIERLHYVTSHQKQEELNKIEHKQALILYVLIFLLLLSFILIFKLTLNEINLISAQRQEIARETRRLAYYDSLTSLANRAHLMERLIQLINKAQKEQSKFAVLFLDLDGFKSINDTFGHDTGDKLLIQTANRINQATRGYDIVSRIGGDEFIIILNEISNNKDVAHVAKKLIGVLESPYKINENTMTVTASIGVSMYPEGGQTSETLIRNADSAMYHSKSLKNHYSFYTPDIT